jgi:hypothetical protein
VLHPPHSKTRESDFGLDAAHIFLPWSYLWVIRLTQSVVAKSLNVVCYEIITTIVVSGLKDRTLQLRSLVARPLWFRIASGAGLRIGSDCVLSNRGARRL